MSGGPVAGGASALPRYLYRYIAATSWHHQIPLLALTIGVFLLEVVPLELQRRVINDIVKHRPYGAVVLLCGAYASAVLVQGSTKLGLNIYRAWVGERAKRDLRRRALLRCRMPFSAARSSARTAARRSSSVPAPSAVPSSVRRALATLVRTDERTARFRMRFRSLDRMRFRAERVLATKDSSDG